MENHTSLSELKTYLRETGCYDSDILDFMRQSTITHTIKNLENNYVNFWQNEINSSEKLDFYRIFTQGFHASSYVNKLICNSNEIEDEIHFLFHCSRYEIFRRSFLVRQSQLFNKSFGNDITLCHALFTTDNKNSIHYTAKYTINCTLLRKT